MKKQGLKFFILRLLAHRLQHWVGWVSQQVGEEAQPVRQSLTNGENGNSGGVTYAPSTLSPSDAEGESVNDDLPPAHWLAHVNRSEPPAHWLARVRRDAPELLRQEGESSGKRAMPPPVLPPRDHRFQAIDAGAERVVPMDEVIRSGKGISPSEGNKETENGEPLSAPANHALAGGRDSPTDDHQVPPLERYREGVMSVGDGLGKRAEAGEQGGGKSSAYPGRTPFPLQSVQKQDERENDVQVNSWYIEHMSEMAQLGGTANEAEQPSKWDGGAHTVYQNTTAVPLPAIPNAREMQAPVEWMKQSKWPELASQSPVEQTLPAMPPGSWQNPSILGEKTQGPYMQKDMSNIRFPVREQQVLKLDQVKGYVPTGTHWPSLPEELKTESWDWEIAQRMWERRQRLDREQRGDSWNA